MTVNDVTIDDVMGLLYGQLVLENSYAAEGCSRPPQLHCCFLYQNMPYGQLGMEVLSSNVLWIVRSWWSFFCFLLLFVWLLI